VESGNKGDKIGGCGRTHRCWSDSDRGRFHGACRRRDGETGAGTRDLLGSVVSDPRRKVSFCVYGFWGGGPLGRRRGREDCLRIGRERRIVVVRDRRAWGSLRDGLRTRDTMSVVVNVPRRDPSKSPQKGLNTYMVAVSGTVVVICVGGVGVLVET
jgi:hypothetical protein